ncbi:MAG: PA2778 family cysteine peptidase [Gammaproteobacteria bacterium]|jgi:tetratricopeptide (TPR) repeat protein
MSQSAIRFSLLLTLWLSLAACRSAPQSEALLSENPRSIPVSAMISDLPFFPQERYQCGPAALATVLSHNDRLTTPAELERFMYLPERQGTFQLEVVAAARSTGRVTYALEPLLKDILIEIDAGNPVIVFQNLGLRRWPVWHFAVVKGYDLEAGTLILNSGTIEDHEMKIKTFERTWGRADHWAIVALNPGELPETANPDAYFASLVDFEHSFNGEDSVVEAFKTALRRWPGHQLLGMGLANLYIERQEYADARLQLVQLLQQRPTLAPAHNNLAHVYLQLGEYARARVHAEAAIIHGSTFITSYQDTLQQINQYAIDQ